MQMAARQSLAPPDTHSITVETRTADGPPPAGTQADGEDGPVIFTVNYQLGEYLDFLNDDAQRRLKSDASLLHPWKHVLGGALAAAALLAMAAMHAAQLPSTWAPVTTLLPAGMHAWLHAMPLAWASAVPLPLALVGAVLAMLYAACHLYLPLGVRVMVALFGAPMFAYKHWRMPRCAFTIDASGIERVTDLGTLKLAWRDIVAVRTYTRGYLLVLKNGALPIPFRCLAGTQAARLRKLVAQHRAGGRGASGIR